mmetsp:Transcript_22284/g.38117  ORF Transcript_22284/g.38117 Transcript_22284/m.38117 type:complete len:210 (-) Transcript_22284:228-857(-)
MDLLQCSRSAWSGGGLLSLERVVQRLRDLLPARFEDLQTDFAVGVVTVDGQHRLIDSGPLPEAVAASAAIPFIFEAVDIPGQGEHNPFKDGGVVDRVGLAAWRARRRAQASAAGHARVPPALVHVISRSSPFSGFDAVHSEPGVAIVHSPKSGVSFFSLGDFHADVRASTMRARPLLVQASAGLLQHQMQQSGKTVVSPDRKRLARTSR